jgi:hypothetical protein
MSSQLRLVWRAGIVIAAVALLAASAGCSLAGSPRGAVTGSTGTTSLGGGAAAPMPADEAVQSEAAPSDAAPSDVKSAATVTPDRLVISTASMNIRVDNVDKALAAVRALAAASGSQISQLNVSAGEGGGEPTPLDDGSISSDSQSSSAQVTLRVPAEKLASVEAQAAKLGKVLSQSAGESDVTQQHVDLSARLKNLQAEEVRIRSFLDKATKVSEMLEIESELSRVRGEIEAMQAQIAYLDQQAAMATLTLALAAPGALVQPAGGTWGFSTAVTTGFQAAAALLRTLIVVVIALSPILLVVLVIALVWRSRRRRAARAKTTTDATNPETALSDTPSPPPTE